MSYRDNVNARRPSSKYDKELNQKLAFLVRTGQHMTIF